MRKLISWVAILALPAMLLTGSLVAADKKADKDVDKPGEKLVKVGTITGKVMAVYEDKRKIRLQVTFAVPKLNVGALSAIQQAQRQMAMASARRDYRGVLQAQMQMQQQQRNLYTIEKKQKEYEFQAIDDVVVRTQKPREQFDDKGRIKKFTKAELKELKGPDPKVPGYKAEFGDLTADQILTLTIVRKKDAPAPKPMRRGKKGKGQDADAVDAELLDDTPTVSLIMIVADPPPSK